MRRILIETIRDRMLLDLGCRCDIREFIGG